MLIQIKNVALKLLIYTVVLTSCNNKSKPTIEPVPPSDTNLVTITTIAKVKVGEFPYYIPANGKIRSAQEQLVNAETGGNIQTLKAATGVYFSKGTIIAQMETTSIRNKLHRAELAKFNTENEYESQLLGYENLLKNKSDKEASSIKKKLKISSGFSGAELDIAEAEYELSRAVVLAPFNGITVDVKVQQGQTISSGQELFRIYDPSHLILEVKILESDINLLHINTPATVSPVGSLTLSYSAVVSEITPYVDENGLVLVKLRIVSPLSNKIKLFPGMNCSAIIKVPLSKTVMVPKEAVVFRSGKAVVFTFESGKAKWNYVIVGRDNGKEVEIVNGLKDGQVVITNNNLQLAHDAPVQIDNSEAKSPK